MEIGRRYKSGLLGFVLFCFVFRFFWLLCHPFIGLLSCFLQRHPCPLPARLPGGLPGAQAQNEEEEEGKGHSLLGRLFVAAGNPLHKDRSLPVRLGKTR